MEANRILEDNLKRFVEKFEELAPKHFSELKSLGETIEDINTSNPEAESFVNNLIRFSTAVIEVRKLSKSATMLKELPVPPYDLWLPFKAKGKMPEPEALSKASQTFTEQLGELTRIWRLVVGRDRNDQRDPLPTIVDPELLQLTRSINDQFTHCNKCCHEIAEFYLFAPAPEIRDELFVHAMPLPVSSVRDFYLFILAVYKVFEEGLPTNIRRWKPGQQLEGPLTQVAEVLDGKPLRQLATLRHKLAGHGYSGDPPSELPPIYENLIGVRRIAPDDAPKWVLLQKAVLRVLLQVLKDLGKVFESSQNN
jgi:hypothetical protein